MERLIRRALIGLIAGAAAGAVLGAAVGAAEAAAGVVVGVAFALAFDPRRRAAADSIAEGAALGVPLWLLVGVVLLPALHGEAPQWSAPQLRAQFASLAGWMLYAAALGAATHALSLLALRLHGPEREAEPAPPPEPKRVLVLGGGFAGVGVARELERLRGGDQGVEVTLVSPTNALVFTPMLAEVAGGGIEPAHISAPLRTALARTRVLRGEAVAVDTAARRVRVATADGLRELAYDHVVLALGGVTNHFGQEDVRRHSFGLKTLADAVRLREHVIDCFERAEAEDDPARRRALLTFVIAGGGFAGAELAGALNDFARGMLAHHPAIAREELRVVLVHGGERILPELGEPLARYAQERMAARGVEIRLRTRVQGARADAVALGDGELPACTLAWTAGTAPHPLLATLPAGRDKRGALIAEPTFAIAGLPGVWALGDCASVPNAATGQSCPPTAQFAVRQALRLARNLDAALAGRAPRPFSFAPLGALCVLGHCTACAELKGLRFSGFAAWFLWRTVYLAKLPGLERKLRVVSDWTIELFFPRDVAQTAEAARATAAQEPRP